MTVPEDPQGIPFGSQGPGRCLTCLLQVPGRGRGSGAEEPALSTPSPRGRAPLGLAGSWGLPELTALCAPGSGKEMCTWGKVGYLTAVGGEQRSPVRAACNSPLPLTPAARLPF